MAPSSTVSHLYNGVLYISVVHLEELTALVVDLRHKGSDTAEIEVKRATGGFPDSLLPTVSAFANTPGGGTIIFGLNESAGFAPVGVYDPAACRATLATKARRALDPPVTFDAWDLRRVPPSSSRGSTSNLPTASPVG